MVERICPACQHGNSLESRYCGKCGGTLERQLPARLAEGRLVLAGRQLPVTWQQLGKTVALSAAALAAEVGFAWLRNRVEAGRNPPAPLAKTTPAARPADSQAMTPRPSGAVTIISQRVIEIWDSGDGHRRIEERAFWQKREE
jgi:hypothetical protein